MHRSEIRESFTYHTPTPTQAEAIDTVRANCRALALLLEEIPMDPRCQALAIEKLEEASMWANKGIVLSPYNAEG